ncbi:Ion transport 2 domain protein [Coraliomargarita akajimensis DSM 45221]|uniref:Ion transport 2 domain protein n=1 Tax=Coraliomargarita akajimensis (strain DSM 45221 / IAM 15411 / JCM 23193 / KCTC 12865 / 04OKA010-24) TaxID=583355 RepID=D5ERF5_CORAD|nr:Ion transport 2 domain protein [Coraliomargarita akajimensis DSM 45221]
MILSGRIKQLLEWRARLEERLGGRYTLTLVSILISLVAQPLAEQYEWLEFSINFLFILTMGFLVVSLHEDRLPRPGFILLGCATLLLIFSEIFSAVLGEWVRASSMVLLPAAVLFVAYCIALIGGSLFRQQQVTSDTLCGAIVAYLLLGIAWAGVYGILELTTVNPFDYGDWTPGGRGAALSYFSFVTLTTLGYGDILPLSEMARTLAAIEAVTGVMFGAIVVAALVANLKPRDAQSAD